MKSIALTGDRPTGPLHLGHYAGSLANRLHLQDDHDLYVLVADMQALTDNAGDVGKVRSSVLEVVADYLAVGLDPDRCTIALQSSLPALPELAMLYANLVSVSRLERNPTVRDEIERKGFGRSVPAGFLCYPVSQAADITAFDATVVPVGADQLPMIEIAREIVGKVNGLAGRQILAEPSAMLSETGRLPGIDGRAKASKSLGNAIDIGDDADQVAAKVRAMFTDPGHVRVSDPGRVEGNVVFAYLDAFAFDVAEVDDLKDRYRAGGLGDVAIKRRLLEILDERFAGVRAERRKLSGDPGYLLSILKAGTMRARERSEGALNRVRDAFGIIQL